MTDPLARLVVDEVEVNREVLAELLDGKVRIDPARGTFLFLPDVRSHSSAKRIIVTALLARKALALLGSAVEERLAPRDIEAISGVRGNTLRPSLKQLVDQGVLSRDVEGRYFVPDFALEDISHTLEGER